MTTDSGSESKWPPGPNVRARVDPELKAAAVAALEAQGRTVTDVIVEALAAVVAQAPAAAGVLEAFDQDVRRAEGLVAEAMEAMDGWTESKGITPNRAYYAQEARNGLHSVAGNLRRARTFDDKEWKS